MKKLIITVTFLFGFFISHSQADSIAKPGYIKNPAFPTFKLLLTDSASFYTRDDLPKKMPVMLMLFNPTCEHCQHETEDILKDIDKFKGIQIVMASSMPLEAIRNFREKYALADHKNIVVGQDTHFYLPGFYSIRNLPFIAFYNSKKNIISVHSGPAPIDFLLQQFKGH